MSKASAVGGRQEEAMDLDPYRVFRSQFASKTVRSAWAKSYGDQFWEESDPPLSQATIDDIKFLTQRLRPGSETKLVDLGCGIGCVGRYLAKEFDTDVEGIDANLLAIRMADELAVTSGMTQRLRFQTGDIAKTGWSDHSFDGALSMDVLVFVPDKRAALQEVVRILKPGGRFVGTTWELRAESAALSGGSSNARPPSAFDDYPKAFRDAGFTIEFYEETRNWRSLLTNALGALWWHRRTRYEKRSEAPRPNGFWRGLGRALRSSNIVEEFASAFSAACEHRELSAEVGAGDR